MTITATYSPEDNKLRIYSLARFDAETYARVKAAGYRWAPAQQLWVAPMWTPERADLAEELAGSIEPEETSLEDRAAERAERFEQYSSNRTRDAERAHAGVKAISDNIPGQQPILRRDQDRIENGMRAAVKNWKLADYWKDRARGAERHADYKARPDVRFRRIKGLEADLRKQRANAEYCERVAKFWGEIDTKPLVLKNDAGGTRTLETFRERVEWALGNTSYGDHRYYSAFHAGEMTPEAVRDAILADTARETARMARWVEHFEGRMVYERALLGEKQPDAIPYAVGGRVQCCTWQTRRQTVWAPITRVNKGAGGSVVSVSTPVGTVAVEDVQGYEPPTEASTAAAKASKKLPPMTNYPGDVGTTADEWAKAARYSDSACWRVVPETETYGAHRRRVWYRGGRMSYVFVTDEKRKDPPAKTPEGGVSAGEMSALRMALVGDGESNGRNGGGAR